ncbi:MAG TPA: hypothetical protein VMF69_08925 [Gemmataceae bacterium]|nr:hypothetical protein [Gemmataceae bacterium]
MLTSLSTRPRWFFLRTRRAPASASPRRHNDWLLPALVFLAAVVLAGCLYARFLRVDRALWYNPYHDRSAHYLYGLKLAADIENGRVLQLLHHLNEARIWPPLHGMAAAAVLSIGGRDYRLAVLPSLAGWVAAVLLAFLVARRAAPRGGALAGLIAAIFLAASPAHRAYAADIMLESLGAALTLLVLYCYLLTVQGRATDTGKARCLAAALLLLFLEKYNYWLLVVLALVAAEVWSRGRLYGHAGRALLRGIDRRWIAAQLRHPLNWGAAALLLASAYVYQQGEWTFQLLGHSISLYPPHNLIHIAYVLMFVRLASFWRRQGRQWTRQIDPRLRQIVLWLVCPIAVWFLLPKHPSYFLWYLSFADRAPQQQMDVLGGFRDYATWAVQDYHGGLACGLMAAILCLCGLLAWRKLRPGGIAVLALVLLASVLTPLHPNHKARMLHSWIPAVWVTAGLGAAALWTRAGSVSDGYSIRRLRFRLVSRRFLLCSLLCFLCVLCGSVVSSFSLLDHAVEGGPHPEQPCMLDVTDAYLPAIQRGGRTLLLTSLPLKPMAQWTWLERFGNFEELEERWYGFGDAGADNRRGFAHWLQTTTCDTLVFCETTIHRDDVDLGPECPLHAELRDMLPGQRIFCLVQEHELPHLACRVQIWRRLAPQPRIVAESR